MPNSEALKGIHATAQCLFMWLCHHANQDGKCFPSRRRLAELCGVSIDTVDKMIILLIEKSLITKTIRKKDEKVNNTNLYEVIIGGVAVGNGHLAEINGRGVADRIGSELNPSSLTQSTKLSFDIFWNLYDKKIGKPKAEKKWNNLSLKDQEAILEHIPKYKQAQPNKTYRKNPETFFNNRSWEDELIIDTTANKGAWKCEYGHMHKKGEECGHALERTYSNSPFSQTLKNKFQIKK